MPLVVLRNIPILSTKVTPADNNDITKNRFDKKIFTPCNKRTPCKGGEKNLDRTPQQGSYPSPKKIKILFLKGTYNRDMIVLWPGFSGLRHAFGRSERVHKNF